MSSPVFPSNIVAIPSGYLASISADGVVVTDPVIRTSATFDGLATATDFVVPGLTGADGGALAVGYAPFGVGSKCYVVGDNDGNIVSSVDLSTWVAGSFPVGQVLIGSPVFVYDDVHHVFIGMTFGASPFGNVVTAPPGAGPLTWTDRGAVPGVTNSISALSYRPGSGVTLAISLYGELNRSTDGGVTWTSLGILAPSGGDPWALAYGQNAWIAVFDNGFAGTRNVYRSTNDGATWTLIVDLAAIGMDAETGNPSILGTDNTGHWVCLNSPPAASAINYAISSNDGLTWSVPGGTSNGGYGPPSIVFESSTVVKTVLFDAATQSLAFAASSSDSGSTWVYGSEFIENTSPGIPVPSIVGLTQFSANNSLVVAGLVSGTVTETYSPTVATGLVIDQNPMAGTNVPSGFSVNYTLSLGPPPIPVPDLIGEPILAAEILLEQSQLVVGQISFVQDSSVKVGYVSSQSPIAGTLVPSGSEVAVAISVTSLPFDPKQTVISQYANSPTLLQLIENMSEYLDPRLNLLDFYFNIWNVDTAQGFGLDIWGRIVGVSRVIPIPGTSGAFGFDNDDVPPDWQNFEDVNNPGGGGPFFAGQASTGSFTLSDGSFRTLILTKALANICATTAPALNQLLRNLFPGRGKCYTLDLGGMKMRYVFEFSLTTVEYAILAFSGVLPHPAGVEVSILVIPSGGTNGTFGFQEAGSTATPFGFGVFYLPPV